MGQSYLIVKTWFIFYSPVSVFYHSRFSFHQTAFKRLSGKWTNCTGFSV